MIAGIVRKSWLVIAFLLVACGKDSTAPINVPTSVALVTTTSMTAVAGSVVTPALTFSVKDQNGNPMAGIPVTITVTSGGGAITGSPTTTSAGETPIGSWTLGNTVSVNTITIKAGSLAPITFSITTVAGPPAKLTVLTGANQSALGGSTVPVAISVKLTDKFDNPNSGRPVTFTVIEGEGSVVSIPPTTDAGGVTTSPPWTLGKIALPQVLRASAGQVVADIPATVQTAFDIEVIFFGDPMSAAQQLFFTRAAARLEALIPGDEVNISGAASFDVEGRCGVQGAAPLPDEIDDVVIFASIGPIDGERNILGQAGPCGFRPGNLKFAPAIGVMKFDVADTALLAGAGSFQDVIMHEMLHVLGIGTIWDANGFLQGEGTPNVAYTGPSGIQGCRDAGGFNTCAQNVPVANVGSAGSINSHWRELTFGNELMTPNLNVPPNPLSLITVGSLEDFGYLVNKLAADSYSVAAGVRSNLRASMILQTGPWEKRLQLKGGIIHPNGRVEDLPFYK